MKALRKALQRPWVACVLIGVVVLGAVLTLRAKGWLQLAEVRIRDKFTRVHSDPNSTDGRIAIVGMTEGDLHNPDLTFPLDDAKLALLLEKIDAQEPAVIGLDMYRDLPEPRSGALYPQLAATFQRLERVIAIKRVGPRLGTDYVSPPPALSALPDRVAANNLPRDYTIDGYYRRGQLFTEGSSSEPEICLCLALVQRFLEAQNVEIGFEETPGGPALRLGKTIIPRLPPDAGGYVGLTVNYEFLADFRAPRRFRVQSEEQGQAARDTPYDYSFGEVLAGKLPPEALRGKIVLVATVMQSIKDSNPTPLDDNLRGVQQHALLVNQLLRAALDGQAPPRFWPEWGEVLWIAAATLLGGWLGLLFRSPWKLALALAVVLAGIGFFGWKMSGIGIWVLVAAPAVGCAMAATFVTSFVAYLERAERGTMQTLFSKHVSAKVADALWANREEFLDGKRMRPKRIVATVLFTDLKGFSTTSEKMDPSTLMDWMNGYMDAIGSHVEAHDGMLSKFIGDAIMAVFGAPISHEDEAGIDRDAANAVNCALAMEKTLIALNEKWRTEGLPTTEMRVGIYTGNLVSGSLGTSERMEFTVLGDTVNTAARLEGAGKEATGPDMPQSPCTILIGEATFERLRGRYRTIPLGAMTLKGKADKINVHRVISLASSESSV